MRSLILIVSALFIVSTTFSQQESSVFVETESFVNKGGWVVDQQSMDVMGSPYLMAHGMGIPVKDASTTVEFPATGKYQVFVRTRNWTSPWSDQAAGTFEVEVGGKKLKLVFGAGSGDWSWIDGGVVKISSKKVKVTLHDLTGFNGRCDAIFFYNPWG